MARCGSSFIIWFFHYFPIIVQVLNCLSWKLLYFLFSIIVFNIWQFFHMFPHISLCFFEMFVHCLHVLIEMLEYIFHMVFNSVNFIKMLDWHFWIYWYLLIFRKNFIGFFAKSICTLNYFTFSIFAYSFLSFFAWFFMKLTISINMRWERARCWSRIRLAIIYIAYLFLHLIHIISNWSETSKTEIVIERVKHWMNFWFLDIEERWHWNHLKSPFTFCFIS